MGFEAAGKLEERRISQGLRHKSLEQEMPRSIKHLVETQIKSQSNPKGKSDIVSM
jgi:hypothetical protein